MEQNTVAFARCTQHSEPKGCAESLRVFEAASFHSCRASLQAKGGSFAVDKDLYRFTVGGNTVIPAFEEAILGMKPGGVRRLVVPIELGYPDNDMNKLGPKPSNFSVSRSSGAACTAKFMPCRLQHRFFNMPAMTYTQLSCRGRGRWTLC